MAEIRRALVLCAVAWLAAGPARADEVAVEVERLAGEAAKAYKAAEYPHAIELLEQAYQLRPLPALLYNAAKTYDRMGEADKAIELYQRYVKTEQARPEEADEKQVQRAEARMTALKEAHHRPPPEATRPEPELPRVILTPPPSATPPVRAPDGPRERRARRRDRYLALGFGLVGAGALGAAVGLGVNALELHDQFAASTDEDFKRSARDTAQTQALAGDILYGVAAVAIGVTIYFLYRGFRAHPAPSQASTWPWPLSLPSHGIVGAQ